MAVIYALLSVGLVSSLSLLGLFFLSLSRAALERFVFAAIALSSGALLATAFYDLLPESLATIPELTPSLILAGIVFFFLVEKIINWHHCHEDGRCVGEQPLGWISLIGDGLHNFTDGVAIAAAFLVSQQLGFVTTVAVIAHEIPHEISDFSLLLHAGFSTRKALLLNFLSALTAVLGATITLILSANFALLTTYLIPVTAGNFIYIAGTDLFPELHKQRQIKSTLWETGLIVAGILLILLVKKFF